MLLKQKAELPSCQFTRAEVLCRAFALEGRGIWHALSASITQQVIGPVRARADFRYALDLPSSIPQVTAYSALFATLLTTWPGTLMP